MGTIDVLVSQLIVKIVGSIKDPPPSALETEHGKRTLDYKCGM